MHIVSAIQITTAFQGNALRASCVLLLITMSLAHGHPAPPAEKVGAGLLLSCQGEVLLLLRAGKHNANTWGLPGGNADATDTDLLHTATREAEEEMGSVPPFTVLDSVLTMRGKRNQKQYTVFVAAMTPETKAAFVPRLNKEHSAWRWFPLQEAMSQLDLHPVVNLVLGQQGPHSAQVAAVLQGVAATSAGTAAATAVAAAPAPAAAAPAAPAATKSRQCCSVI